MNNGIVDIMQEAGTLSTLSAEHVAVLQSLPSDMYASIVSAASATALAQRVAKELSRQHGKRATYGNEVTDMMENFFYGEEPEEEHQHTR